MDNPESETTGGLQKVLFFLKLLEIRLRFVLVLVITALIVGYWDTIQNYYERWTRPQPAEELAGHAHSETEFFCPMHPFVVRETPGKCPICGMDLVPRKKGVAVTLPEGTLARVQVSPERVIQAGVRVEPVAYRLLVRTVASYGTIDVDETRLARVSARFPGRVEELFVNATGVEVKKGDPLARIYSPKYLAATYDYLQALQAKRDADADPNAGAEAKRLATEMAEATRKPLERQGFTKEQLDAIAQTGKTPDRLTFFSPVSGTVLEKNVVAGDTLDENAVLYTIADLSTVWIYAQIIESDLPAIKNGMAVEVTSVAAPGKPFYGTVDLVYPTLSSENRSAKVRIVVPNKDGALKPGMYVNTTIRAPLGRFEKVGDAGLPKSPASGGAAANVYTCPMHPQIVSDKPGECPICGMDLVKKHGQPTAGLPVAQDSDPRWVEGYTCPHHPELLAPTPGVCQLCGCEETLTKWREERVPAIPETAVIDTGTRQVVYVESSPGVYDARAVKLGARAGEFYPVLEDSLAIGDRVVSHGSFLIDAEARLNPANTSGEIPAPPMQHEPSMPGMKM